MVKIVIRPLSSERGSMTLFTCLIISAIFLIIGGVGLAAGQSRNMCFLFFILAVFFAGFGVVRFYAFPGIRLVFDGYTREVNVRTSPGRDHTIPFEALAPFVIRKVIRNSTRLYYCSNESFKTHTHLFVSPFRKKVLRKATRLCDLTGCTLIDNSI